MVKRLFIYFLAVLFFVSCAIHAKFPFICFRWSCIAAELKLPSFNTSGMKKQRKANASLRKKKRQRRKNKRLAKKGISIKENNTTADSGEMPQRLDSLKYRFTVLKEERYIIISFEKKDPVKTDSLFVRYNSDEDDVLDYDKQFIKMYLDSNKVETITLIKVREHFGDKEEDQRQNKHTSVTKEHIASFLMKLGVPREKIRLSHRK